MRHMINLGFRVLGLKHMQHMTKGPAEQVQSAIEAGIHAGAAPMSA
jgi:hypothetical protein